MQNVFIITHAAIDSSKLGEVLNPILNPIISNLVTPVLVLMFAVATVVFIYGVLQLVIGGGADAESRTKWKSTVMWGLIGMFIMVSAWGIVMVISNTIKGI